MKLKSNIKLFSITLLTLSFSFLSLNNNKTMVSNADEEIVITLGQYVEFLSNKKEHYPFSDEFIEKYQQTSGGYLDTAVKNGIEVNKEKHSPNQKWHFFVSWYEASLKDGTAKPEEPAKNQTYNRLLCPELNLWLYEASGVEPSKVKKAFDIAVQGKINKTNLRTVNTQMHEVVPWEDIANNVIAELNLK